MLVACLLGALSARCASALVFHIAIPEEQCLSEEVGAENVLVYARFNVTKIPVGVSVDIRVTSTEDGGKKFVEEHRETISSAKDGKFAFTSDASEEFKICFSSHGPAETKEHVEVAIDVRTGIDAKDYSTIAKQEHLSVLEVELKKLEDEVKQIIDEMVYMRNREEAMRNTNESTNARVLWFSVFSVAVLLSTAAWQVYHLKQYFKKKKLI